VHVLRLFFQCFAVLVAETVQDRTKVTMTDYNRKWHTHKRSIIDSL